MQSGLSYNNPKKYKVNLSPEERAKMYPEGTYVLIKNKVLIMKNNRPYFTDNTNNKNVEKHSKCYGKNNILDCPEDDCVFHLKSKQCRLKKYSSKKVIEEDKKYREQLKNINKDEDLNENINKNINKDFIYNYNDNNNNNFNVKKNKNKTLNILQKFIDKYNNEPELIYIKKILKKLEKHKNKMLNNKKINYNDKSLKDIYNSSLFS